jgi:hypothetical protein
MEKADRRRYMKKVILFFWAAIILSCASTLSKEPNEEYHTLLTGQLHLKALNCGWISGEYKNGIQLLIKDTTKGEITTLRSIDKAGHFFLFNPEHTEYELVKLKFKRTRSDSTGKETSELSMSGFHARISIEYGKVNNLGIIHWMFDDQAESGVSSNIGYRHVQQDFGELYADSDWNELEWRSIRMR